MSFSNNKLPAPRKNRHPVKLEIHDGVPVPVGREQTLEQTAEIALAASCLEECDTSDITLAGKNNLEAAIATLARDAALGMADARKELLDRVLGKPLQRQDIRSQNVTLVGFLDQLADEDDAPKEVFDAE